MKNNNQKRQNKWISFFLIYTISIVGIVLPNSAFAQKRDGGEGVGVGTVTKLPSKEKRWALIIGIDEYEKDVSSLRGAVNDAKALKDVLVNNAGFPEKQVILLTSDAKNSSDLPKRENILDALTTLTNRVPEDGLLLFSFSGHGVSIDQKAFLVPSNGRITKNPFMLKNFSIDVETIKQAIQFIKVKQVLMLIDACRNEPGKGDVPNILTDAYKNGFSFDVRNNEVEAFATLFATSVGDRAFEFYDNETKQYRGYFSKAIEEALRGKAANEKGEVTLSSLISYIENTVPKKVKFDKGERQIPSANYSETYKANELVLSLTQIAKVEPKPTPRPTPLPIAPQKSGERLFWEDVAKENTISSYESYLRNYPKGEFQRLANRRISKLKVNETVRKKKQEKQDWETAQKANTIVAYENYKKNYPNGQFVSFAESKIQNLKPKIEVKENTNESESKLAQLKSPKAGMSLEREIAKGVEMEFVGIPIGSFLMGSGIKERKKALKNNRMRSVDTGLEIYENEEPQRQIAFKKGFWMGKYEVTIGEWKAVMGDLPNNSNEPKFSESDRQPVNGVSWVKAKEFVKKLNIKDNELEYSLPSEAEWEYACRANNTNEFGVGKGKTITSKEAKFLGGWHSYGKKDKTKISISQEKTMPVGSYKPNAWELFDMHGNVLEWTEDIYKNNYNNLPTDGSANTSQGNAKLRVLRGGHWFSMGSDVRSASRYYANSYSVSGMVWGREHGYGFRLVVRHK